MNSFRKTMMNRWVIVIGLLPFFFLLFGWLLEAARGFEKLREG